MKLKVKFGLIDTKEVFWYKPLEDFPKLVEYLGYNYEWLLYDKDLTGQSDMILIFTELSTYDLNYNTDCPLWVDLFGNERNDCECGAKYSRSFSFDHMRYCRKWTKW